MDNYIKVTKDMFSLLKIGDYIRWEKKFDEGITKGAAIERIGKKDGKKNWQLRNGNVVFSMYWEDLEYIWLKKHPIYNILEEKINILSSSIAFIVKEFGIEGEFVNFNKNLKQALYLRRSKSLKDVKF